MWSGVETVETIGKVGTWLAAAFGLLAGIAGIVAALSNARADKLRDDFKRTPPAVDVVLVPGPPGTLIATIESKNHIPLFFSVTLVTIGGRVLGGIPLESQSLHPTAHNQVASVVRHIDPTQILEGYLEVRVRYRSKHQDEFPSLTLSGYLAKAFCYSQDGSALVPCPQRIGS